MTNLIIICILLFVIFCNILLCFQIGNQFEPMFNIVDENEESNNYETSNLLNENTEDNYKSNIDKININNMYSKASNMDELNELTSYDSNNYDIEYHDNESDLEKEQGFGLDPKEILVYDSDTKQLNKLSVPSTQTLPIYNEPGHFKYGASNYVPSYSDSILLSTRHNFYEKTLFR